MKFAIIGKDGPEGRLKRPRYRSIHLQRLKDLAMKGKLILAGPFKDQTGSLIVIEAETLADAEHFAHEDPYTLHGVFQQVEIHPFEQIFPNGISE